MKPNTNPRRMIMLISIASTLFLSACGDGTDSVTTTSGTDATPAIDTTTIPADDTTTTITDDDGTDGNGTDTGDVIVGFANIAEPQSPILAAIDLGMRAEADKRGWELLVMNNDRDGPTAVSNAETMIAQGVTHVVEFQSDATVAPQIMSLFDAEEIPVIAIDIAHPGAYFFGVNNPEVGRLTGRSLGAHASEEWNCEVDLVMLLGNQDAGTINDLRMGGIETGIKEICPDLDDSVIESRHAGATPDAAQPVARDILAAHPDAERILLGGLNDNVVIGGINAAEQLDRDEQLYAYGLGADLLLAGVESPKLAGSTAFFLEGYPLEIFGMLDEIVAGTPPPVVDDPLDPDAAFVPACAMPAETAAELPSLDERLVELYEEGGVDNAASLYCPEGVETYGLDG